MTGKEGPGLSVESMTELASFPASPTPTAAVASLIPRPCPAFCHFQYGKAYCKWWKAGRSLGTRLAVAILDGQNFCQKLQALAVIKIQTSIRKLLVSSVEWSLLVVVNCVDKEVIHVFIQISIGRKLKTAGTRANYFWVTHNFSQRVANGTLFDVHWSLVAQAIPENKLFFFSKMSNFQNC